MKRSFTLTPSAPPISFERKPEAERRLAAMRRRVAKFKVGVKG